MPFSRDTHLKLGMMLTRLSGAKSLRHSQLRGEWVASSPLTKARWYDATEVAPLPVINSNQIEAVKQYASVFFPVPELNVPKGGLRHVSEVMTRRGAAYTAATGLPLPHHPFTRPLHGHMEGVGLAACARSTRVRGGSDPPTSGRSWPLQSWARCIQSRPPLVDTID